MYVMDGVAYAGEKTPELRVCGVRPLEDYKLWLRFSTGESKIFDFSALLSKPAFAPLIDKAVFQSVYIDYGITVWNDGEIDIAPKFLYENAISADDVSA